MAKDCRYCHCSPPENEGLLSGLWHKFPGYTKCTPTAVMSEQLDGEFPLEIVEVFNMECGNLIDLKKEIDDVIARLPP